MEDLGGFGISFSGGGIRAASYALGVLQEMHEHGMITGARRARWLSAVSGGSYLAGAVASVARGPLGPDDPGLALTLEPPPASDGNGPAPLDGRPFASQTPEERYLRDHLRYLTHVTGGLPGAVWRMVLGIMLNLGFLALTLHLVMRPLGWAYGWAIPALRTRACTAAQQAHGACQVNPVPWHVHSWGIVLLLTGILGAAATVFGLAWVGIRWSDDDWRGFFGWGSGTLLAIAALVFVFGVGVVAALHILRTTIGNQVPPGVEGMHHAGPASSAHAVRILGLAVGGGVVGVSLSAVGAVRHVLARVDVEPTLWRRVRGPLINLVAAVTGPALLIVLSLLFISWGAAAPIGVTDGGDGAELLRWAVPSVVLLVAWWFADLVAWSLHPLYKRGLSLAFMLERISAPPGGSATSVDGQDAVERPFERPYPLSRMQPGGLPEILICAAANISDYGQTPTGLGATSFVFSAEQIGGPLVGPIDTATYEKAVGWRLADVTLPAAISIAGAAFSPSMGKMTRAPLRFVLAITNLRLGVWVPNPRRIADFDVTGIRAKYRLRPRPGWLVRELFGRNHLNARYLYVTDGGHYENLGLVELLRRRCTWIWCVDAAGDRPGRFTTLGEAMALASAELGIEIDLDPTVMAAAPGPDGEVLVHQPYAVGTIRYPDGAEGRLVVLKAGVSADAPWSVRSYHLNHSEFPCDSTIDQLYDAERFDAYRELGRFAMRRAWIDVGAEFDAFRVVDQRVTVSRSSGR